MSVDAQVNPNGSTPDQTQAAVAEMQALLNPQTQAQPPAQAGAPATPQTQPAAPAVDPSVVARAVALNIDPKVVEGWGENAQAMVDTFERQMGATMLQMLGQDFQPQIQQPQQPVQQPAQPMQYPGQAVIPPVQQQPVQQQPMFNPGQLPQEIQEFLSYKPDPDETSPEVVKYHGHAAKAFQKVLEHSQAQVRALDEQAFQALSGVMQAVKVNEFDNDLSEIISGNAELEKVFGKGPTRRISRASPQFEARNQLAYAVDNAPIRADRYSLMRIMASAMAMQSAAKPANNQPVQPAAPRNADGTFAPRNVQIIPANQSPTQPVRKTDAEIHQERMDAAIAEVRKLNKK